MSQSSPQNGAKSPGYKEGPAPVADDLVSASLLLTCHLASPRRRPLDYVQRTAKQAQAQQRVQASERSATAESNDPQRTRDTKLQRPSGRAASSIAPLTPLTITILFCICMRRLHALLLPLSYYHPLSIAHDSVGRRLNPATVAQTTPAHSGL
ncbi:hypothetical protein NA57DRAFT_51454 [Rhizodiscina lignyota]|uniref:Uncharacterized protein n=1 Tax=Rhizodiscina lignyota TaxID=1504668 RepID=A0A9P4MEN2_9PEZI|nr:hypothetical protein NA57DRAFT_51454 [Rhizodiscina lignyota]